ncbi:MAG TPA: glycerol kinase GlpK [Verrucomicrobiota bacterium]|nr:glycerol kinase GlpK [Verrucomicrobiota bacterium]
MILAIDQSTSATKAVLFERTGAVLDKASRDHRQIYPQPGWDEHDPDEIWQNVLAVARELTARHNLADLHCISISNQRETVLVFDRATGKPLYNAIVWQCRRGEPICRELREQDHEDRIRAKTGLKLDTYFSASKLKWLIAEKPDIAAQLSSGNAVAGTIDTFLLHRLTGGKVVATDHTNASRTLLFDITQRRWDPELCDVFDVPLPALPEVRESAAHFGETTLDGILPKPVPICGVMGDSQASLFAQRCFKEGMAKATFGTGTSVLLNIGGTPRPSAGGAITALAWVYQGTPTYAFEGIINFSAATVEWLKNQLQLIQNVSEVEPLATSVPDTGGVYLIPAFAGLSAPYWAPDARAAILGMTGHTRKEHVVRAALESIAYQIRDVLDMMRADSSLDVRRLEVDGGPTRNRFLMQFTADITGAELHVSPVPESSAWGAALCGLLGMGICRSLDEAAAIPRETTVFKPAMDSASAQRLYDGWRHAVRRVL